ncbi:major facilitator superfamily domain-containing protein [Phlyctochytrium arcticum]|nr:major facilitator superfamily domain-containing protein [Phlyctochytrium arcticum]
MPEYDPQELQLVRRLDARIVPMLAALYLAFLIDRTTYLNYASPPDGSSMITTTTREIPLATTTAMVDVGSTWTPHLGYALGSLLAVLPSIFLSRRLGPAKCMAGMVGGAGVLACVAAAVGGNGLAAWWVVRILGGIVQAGFIPVLMMQLVSFYTREEWATRISWVVYSATLVVAFGGVFDDFRGGPMDGSSPWRWIFICNGALSLVVAGLTFFFLPDYPHTTGFLTPADRVLAIARSNDGSENGAAGGINGLDDQDEDAHVHIRRRVTSTLIPPKIRFYKAQMIHALLDIRTWIYGIAFLGAVSGFEGVVGYGGDITSLGFGSGRHARILGCLPFILGAIVGTPLAWNSDRTGDRALHAIGPLLTSAAGLALLSLIPHTTLWAYFVGVLPATAGLTAALPCLLAYALDKAQGETPRSTVAGISFALGTSLSVPLASLPVRPATAAGLAAITVGIAAACITLIRFLYRREETELWQHGPGLRRLLNDREEDKAWDMELSHGDLFGSPARGKRGPNLTDGKKKKRRKSAGRDAEEWDLQEYAGEWE